MYVPPNIFDGLVYQIRFSITPTGRARSLFMNQRYSRPSESIYPQQRGMRIALTLFGHLVGGIPVCLHAPPHKSSRVCQG